MKTLVIQYLPSGAQSHTLKLLRATLELLRDQAPAADIETLDLLAEDMPAFRVRSMDAYIKRNYLHQTLTPDEAASLATQDRLVRQFKAADVVIMAYPMHNFGMPGLVKLYFDAIMLNGETFTMGKKHLAGKRALTLYTAGGQYPQHQVTLEYPNWDTLTLNAQINFGFMGFDEASVIGASLRDPATVEPRLREAKDKIRDLIRRWYG